MKARLHSVTLLSRLGAVMAALVLAAGLLLIAPGAQAQDKPIKVGVTAGPHAEIMEVVKKVAEKEGLKIQIVEFSDYIQPNAALDHGDLDANSYQHQPFLDQQIKDRGYKLTAIAKTVTFPIGIYSKKVKSLSQVPQGGKIAIPNDPTNGGRVLALLEKQGLIKIKPGITVKATLLDITENPKHIKFVELDAAQLPRSLEDVDAASINTNYAITAGLIPARDAIAMEEANSPYANLLVVRTQDKDLPVFKKLVQAYHSAEVKDFIVSKYNKSLIPAW